VPLLAVAVWWLWWLLPKREAARLALKGDAKGRADVEDNFRKTVSQTLGGIAVLVGVAIAYLQFSEQQRSSHDLLISNQVSKGFEQLGKKDSVVVRLGGVYALEGVMNNSDEYRQPILDALIAFVREGTTDNTPSTQLPTDVQAALTVIGRRSASRTGLDRIDLRDARLSRAGLTGANLSGANLNNTYLIAAKLPGANLSRANLTITHLDAAGLAGADLTGARLVLTDLTGADLTGADLTGADLTGTHLTGADLTGARLDGQKQLDKACGSTAKLPQGLTLNSCLYSDSPTGNWPR
jgi:uncharacterized protein YjbI with pentapeptide repeats